MRDVSANSSRRAPRRGADGGRTEMKTVVLLALGTAIVWTSCQAFPAAQQREEAVRAFKEVATVLSSARCANCHIRGGAPLQGEDAHPHAMRVRRGIDGRGTPAMRCSNCHQD